MLSTRRVLTQQSACLRKGSLNALIHDLPEEVIRPHQYDILATDYREGTLDGDVSKLLGIPYLSEAKQHYVPEARPASVLAAQPWHYSAAQLDPAASRGVTKTCTGGQVRGRIWGRNQRPMVTLPVTAPEHTKLTLNVHFLIETGSPLTFLTTSALRALDLPPEFLYDQHVRINDTKLPVNWSDESRVIDGVKRSSHFAHINILGMDFLRQAEASFEVHAGSPRYSKLTERKGSR